MVDGPDILATTPLDSQEAGIPSTVDLVPSLRADSAAQTQQSDNVSPTNSQDNILSETVLRTIVSNESDALRLLFRAAEQSDAQSPRPSTTDSQKSPVIKDHPSFTNSTSAATGTAQRRAISPSVTEVWNAFRFTKMGWFTAEEAVAYMDL